MIASIFMLVIEIQLYSYVTIKLITEYNRAHLMMFTFITNYKMFGLMMAIYITFLNFIVMNYVYIPHIAMILYTKNRDTFVIRKINTFMETYKINTACKSIVFVGDVMMNITRIVASNILKKIDQRHPSIQMVQRNQNINQHNEKLDYENLEKLSTELDEILGMGMGIISKVVSGEKNTQTNNVKTFMERISSLGEKTNNKKKQ